MALALAIGPLSALADAPATSPLPAEPAGRAPAAPNGAAPDVSPPPDNARVRWMRPPVPGADAGTAEDERPTQHAVIAAPRPPRRPTSLPQPVRQDIRTGIEQSALIGVMDLSTGRTALMMLPGGDIRRVGVGDTVGGWRVASIASDAIRVTRGGQFRTLLMVGR